MSDVTTGGLVSADELVDDSPQPLIGGIRLRARRPVLLWFAIAWVALLAIAALTAGFLPLRPPEKLGTTVGAAPFRHWPEFLGTDALGRSQLSRAIHGTRVSLGIGLGSALLGLCVALILGLLAGYFRGAVDGVIVLIVDVLLAFPALILLLALRAVLEPSATNLILALALYSLPNFTRVIRANTLSMSNHEYVSAARLMGFSHLRVIRREIMPNIVVPVMSYVFIVVAVLIVAEGSLSFLGLGLPSSTPSWGGMIAGGRTMMDRSPGIVAVPAALLFLTVFSFNVIGDEIRRRYDPRASAL